MYLDDRTRYRDKTKSDFNGTLSSIFYVDFDHENLIFSHIFFTQKIEILFVILRERIAILAYATYLRFIICFASMGEYF